MIERIEFESKEERKKVLEDINSLYETPPINQGYSRAIFGFNDKRTKNRASAKYNITDSPNEKNTDAPFITRKFKVDLESNLIQELYKEWIINRGVYEELRRIEHYMQFKDYI